MKLEISVHKTIIIKLLLPSPSPNQSQKPLPQKVKQSPPPKKKMKDLDLGTPIESQLLIDWKLKTFTFKCISQAKVRPYVQISFML